LLPTAKWPAAAGDQLDPTAELGEFLVTRLIEDARKILKLVPTHEGRLHIYTAEPWKTMFLRALAEARRANRPPRAALAALSDKQTIPKAELGRLMEPLVRVLNDLGDELVAQIAQAELPNEVSLYQEAVPFLERELKVRVVVHSPERPEGSDPRGRARLALPTKPGLFVE
jgi:hypothetical protein